MALQTQSQNKPNFTPQNAHKKGSAKPAGGRKVGGSKEEPAGGRKVGVSKQRRGVKNMSSVSIPERTSQCAKKCGYCISCRIFQGNQENENRINRFRQYGYA